MIKTIAKLLLVNGLINNMLFGQTFNIKHVVANYVLEDKVDKYDLKQGSFIDIQLYEKGVVTRHCEGLEGGVINDTLPIVDVYEIDTNTYMEPGEICQVNFKETGVYCLIRYDSDEDYDYLVMTFTNKYGVRLHEIYYVGHLMMQIDTDDH